MGLSGPTTLASLGASQRRWWLCGALLFAFLRVLPDLCYPLFRDQSTYCLVGQGIVHGQVLYHDLWDNKPPGIFFVFALIVKLFGPVMWSVGVVNVLWLLAISYGIFRFAEPYLGPVAAAIAVVFNAAWHCDIGAVNAAQPETFLTLLVFAAWFLLRPGKPHGGWRSFFAGVLLAGAFSLKYNAVAFFPFLFCVPYLDFSRLDDAPRKLRLNIPIRELAVRVGWVATGFAALALGMLAYFWVAGAWADLKEVQFEVLPRYGAMFFERVHVWRWAVLFTYRFLGPWTEAMLALTLLIAWTRRELSAVAPVVLMGIAGYASTAMQGRFAEFNFETAFPFFAMFWGYVIVKGCEAFRFTLRYFSRRGWRLAQGLLWVAAANVVYIPLPEEALNIEQEYQAFRIWLRDPMDSYAKYPFPYFLEHLNGEMAVIEYLQKNSRPSDRVYVWGTAPLINFLTPRPFPSRFTSNLALISPWAPPRWRDELVRDLERTPPRFIVVARNDAIPFVAYTWKDSERSLSFYPKLLAFINGGYAPVFNIEDFQVYRAKSD